jgi:hypothetical protein
MSAACARCVCSGGAMGAQQKRGVGPRERHALCARGVEKGLLKVTHKCLKPI